MKIRKPLVVVMLTKKQRKFFKHIAILLLIVCFISVNTAPANACAPAITAGAAGGAITLAAIPVAPIVLVGAAIATGVGLGWYIYKAETENRDQEVPQKARDVVDQIDKNNGQAPPGYKGGREFKNYEGKLPEGTNYQEYDVNPAQKGIARDGERVVLGNDGSAWYSPDHYRSFKRVK